MPQRDARRAEGTSASRCAGGITAEQAGGEDNYVDARTSRGQCKHSGSQPWCITGTFDSATISGAADNCLVTILIASRNDAVSIDSADATISQLAIRTVEMDSIAGVNRRAPQSPSIQ